MTPFDPAQHPRDRVGKFTEKPRGSAEVELVEHYTDAPTVVHALVKSIPNTETLLTEASAAGGTAMTADEVEWMLGDGAPEHPHEAFVAGETAYWRGKARRNGDGELVSFLGTVELHRADTQVQNRWGVRELDSAAAGVLAETIFRQLPVGAPQWKFPRLAEVAAASAHFDHSDEAKVDALHAEFTAVYEGLSFANRRRVDMLYTWALHGSDEG